MLNSLKKDKLFYAGMSGPLISFCCDLSLTTELKSFLLTVENYIPGKLKSGELLLFYQCKFLGLRRAYIKKTNFYEQSARSKWPETSSIRLSNSKENRYLSWELGRPFFNALIIPLPNFKAVFFLELGEERCLKELIDFFQYRKAILELNFQRIYKNSLFNRGSYLWNQLFFHWVEPLALLKDFKILQTNLSFQKAISKNQEFFKKKQLSKCIKVKNKTYQLFYYSLNESLGILYAQDMTRCFFLKGQLFQTEKMLDLFKLGKNMAHQLNNPLTGVKAMTQILRRNPKLKHFQTEFQELEKAIERSGKIIQNFLSFSEIGKGFKSCDLNQVIQATLPLLKSMTKQIKLKKALSKEPLKVKGDFALFQQIIYNLVLNGCQALMEDSQNPQPTLTIVTDKISEDKICLKIKDNGIGIPADHLDKIFQAFWTSKKDGTGFGLGVTKKIVEKHKGEIFVSSREKGQTCFTVMLPSYCPETLLDMIDCG